MVLADERIANVVNNLKRDITDFNKINKTLYNKEVAFGGFSLDIIHRLLSKRK